MALKLLLEAISVRILQTVPLSHYNIIILVEVPGVEPGSEANFQWTSTHIVGYLILPQRHRPAGSVKAIPK